MKAKPNRNGRDHAAPLLLEVWPTCGLPGGCEAASGLQWFRPTLPTPAYTYTNPKAPGFPPGIKGQPPPHRADGPREPPPHGPQTNSWRSEAPGRPPAPSCLAWPRGPWAESERLLENHQRLQSQTRAPGEREMPASSFITRREGKESFAGQLFPSLNFKHEQQKLIQWN